MKPAKAKPNSRTRSGRISFTFSLDRDEIAFVSQLAVSESRSRSNMLSLLIREYMDGERQSQAAAAS